MEKLTINNSIFLNMVDEYKNQCKDGSCYYENDDESCTCSNYWKADEEVKAKYEAFNND